jgi:diketogulonate reductase-like aldo/keto reductase
MKVPVVAYAPMGSATFSGNTTLLDNKTIKEIAERLGHSPA